MVLRKWQTRVLSSKMTVVCQLPCNADRWVCEKHRHSRSVPNLGRSFSAQK